MKKQTAFFEIYIVFLVLLAVFSSAVSIAQPASDSVGSLPSPVGPLEKNQSVGTAAIAPGGDAAPLPKVPVSFTLNDSMVKDKILAGVMVGLATSETGDFLVKGVTDQEGKFRTELAPGKYFVSYNKSGYIPLPNSPIDVDRERPNAITVTLSMMMESMGTPLQKRVQVVLNWGSRHEQVKDIDSHLVCSCNGADAHISYNRKGHTTSDHGAELDVDDTDWGGPETVTVKDAPAGRLRYWVHNFTGKETRLGDADVVVRVILGDKMAGEFRIPAGVKSRVWLPFKSIEVDQMLEPRIIPFTPEEMARGEDQQAPQEMTGGEDQQPPAGQARGVTETGNSEEAPPAIFFIIGLVVVILVLRRFLGTAKSV